jgi:DNA-directed RNA polymerase specialized sigma24 family protein
VRDDEQLLAAARAGDGDAFAAFYRRHVGDVTAYLRRRVASPELAFDLTAETFAAAVGALEPIVLDDEALARVDELAAGADLEAALAALPAAEREAIEGRVVGERGYAELADELRCSEAVVRQRVSRGLRRLRSAMEERT